MEALMSSLNHHKVHRNLFIIKGGIEVAKLFFGQHWTWENDNLALSLDFFNEHHFFFRNVDNRSMGSGQGKNV